MLAFAMSMSVCGAVMVRLYVGFRDVYVGVWSSDGYVVRVSGQLYRVRW